MSWSLLSFLLQHTPPQTTKRIPVQNQMTYFSKPKPCRLYTLRLHRLRQTSHLDCVSSSENQNTHIWDTDKQRSNIYSEDDTLNDTHNFEARAYHTSCSEIFCPNKLYNSPKHHKLLDRVLNNNTHLWIKITSPQLFNSQGQPLSISNLR